MSSYVYSPDMDLLTDLYGATGPKPPKEDRFPSADTLGRRLKCPHAVVIGAGFGGLAAAIRLGVRGYRVTILEKLDAPGGRASVFRQDGFTFDTGPTIVTAPFLLEELWRVCGRDMATDVTLSRLIHFTKFASMTGRRSIARQTPTRCGPRSLVCRLAMSGALSASCG